MLPLAVSEPTSIAESSTLRQYRGTNCLLIYLLATPANVVAPTPVIHGIPYYTVPMTDMVYLAADEQAREWYVVTRGIFVGVFKYSYVFGIVFPTSLINFAGSRSTKPHAKLVPPMARKRTACVMPLTISMRRATRTGCVSVCQWTTSRKSLDRSKSIYGV